MKFLKKKTAFVLLIVSVLLLAPGLSIFALDVFNSKEIKTNQSAEKLSAETVNALNFQDVMKYPKAKLSYGETNTEEKAANITAVKQTEKSKKEKIENFKVPLPEDSTVVYDCDPAPLDLYDTRDISNEYYTVYDLISGKTVTINAFEMLCEIVYNEISDGWGAEAIEAQAVAAYSYVRFNDETGRVPTVGLKTGYSSVIENCVTAVQGQAVTYEGEVINAVYSASTAGCTVQSGDVWGVQYPYLVSVESLYDENDPYYGVETVLSVSEVKKLIQTRTDIQLSDNIKNWFEIDSVYSRKHIGNMKIDGYSGCKLDGTATDITGRTLADILGLRSNSIDIEYKDGNFIFTTYGWGHGVGMSQWGACFYANAGYSYDWILRHYYLNTDLKLTEENEKAVDRGQKSEQEIEEEQTNAIIVDDNEENRLNVQNDSSLETGIDKQSSSAVDNADLT